MQKIKLHKICLAIFTLFIFSSCSTMKHAYEGPKQPEEKIAQVVGFTSHWETLLVVGVGDKRFLHLREYPYGVYLLPGKHHLTIQHAQADAGRLWTVTKGIEVTVEAGEKYQIKHQVVQNTNQETDMKIWVEDGLGNLVSVEVGNALEPTVYGWQPVE